jgi:long-chain fatty acid transport protein
MRVWFGLALCVSGTASAGSIQSPGVIAGPDSSAATVDPAAIYYNPAAIAPSEGFHGMLDTQLAAIRVNIDSTRNGGIDPNTGEPYEPAEASVVVPVNLLGFTYKLVEDRVAVGLAVTQPFTGGGDYTKGEENPPPYTSHQRYFGIKTRVITAQITPAVGVTVVDGVHVGAGGSFVYDSISATQASDPLGSEGAPIGGGDPYSGDSVLEAAASGSHFSWNAGIFVDKVEKLQVGASYTHGGRFNAEGEGTVTLPSLLQTEAYDGPIGANVTFEMPLPAVGRVWFASQVNEKLRLTAGWEYYYWNACCGDHEGDLRIGVTDQNPDDDNDAIDAGERSAAEVKTEQFSPRRVWNATNLAATAGYQANDKLWVGGRLAYNQFAIPDYAVSATNLDFTNIGGMLGVRYNIGGPVTLGVAYTKFFPQTRTITTSAWDVRDEDDDYFVDEYLSPKSPYKANANGEYSADVDIVGIRVQVDL